MNFHKIRIKAKRESKQHSIISKFIAVILVGLIQNPKSHQTAFFLARLLNTLKLSIADFYLAELYFLYGKYTKAENHVTQYLRKFNNPDAIYLLSNIYSIKNDKNKAWHILEKTLDVSPRLKTWLILANLTNTDNDFHNYQNLYVTYREKFIKSKNELDNYLIVAATRSRNYEVAKNLLKEILLTKSNYANKIEKKQFSPTNAKIALKDIESILSEHGIQMFLVSGTFLGCIREGEILKHDQDIDVGVWNTHTYSELAHIIQTSGKFILHEPLSHKIIKAKHLNGILVDVFIHYQDNNFIYHEGVKSRWHNSLFELTNYNFLGHTYLGAKDYDSYLKENYGNWKVENKNFNYILDTPNIEIINTEEYIIHLYKLLLTSYGLNNRIKILNELSELNETVFVKTYQTQVLF